MRLSGYVLLCLGLLLLHRNLSAGDVTADNDAGSPVYTEVGTGWITSGTPGHNGGSYRFTQSAGNTATWKPVLPYSTVYHVSAIFRSGGNRPASVPYTIAHVTGTSTVRISQQGAGDMVEVPLGVYSFAAGNAGSVRLTAPDGAACIADALVFRMGTPADDPPMITAVLRWPSWPTASTSVQVTGIISDEVAVSSASLWYKTLPSGAEALTQAFDDGAHGDSNAGDGIYGATIPAQPDGTEVRFQFRALDGGGLEGRSGERTYFVNRQTQPEFRAIWADSWNASFRSPSEADDLVDTCRAANINMLLPEVRKVGDAYYDSALEPRATNITGGETFDPLQYVLDRAHDTSNGKKRLQVHAWFVMNRIATGNMTLPAGHVLVQHPEYEMLRSDGTIGSTRYLDPGHPGAVDHNLAVVLDCLSKYNLDGYHFDYIRYPESAGEWGYNAVSVARFNEYHGRTGNPEASDPAWKAWRRECVSLMVKKIYVKSWMIKPEALLTASTVNWGWGYDDWTHSAGYNHVFQDWSGWLQDGILDYNSLMNYSRLTDPARFQGWGARSLADDSKRGSIIGVAAYLSSTIQGSMDQLLHARASGAEGLNIYDWGSEVQGSTSGESRAQFYQALKDQVFPTWVEPPVPEWRANPTTGIYEGNVTFEGEPVDHATVRVAGYPDTETVTDGSGWFGILHVPPGTHTLEFTKAGLGSRSVRTSIPQAGDIVTVDADLSETDPPAAPLAPSGLNAETSGPTIVLSWLDNSSDEAGFKIERAGGSGSEFVVLDATGAETTQYVDHQCQPGTNYCYRVRAYNDFGSSEPSNPACATIVPPDDFMGEGENPGGAGDLFGYSIAGIAAATRLGFVVGAPGYDSDGRTDVGRTYLFFPPSTSPTLVLENPAPPDDSENTWFGAAVGAVGNSILVGAPGRETPYAESGSGRVYMFDASTGALQRSFMSPDSSPGDRFGEAVSALGKNDVVIGAPGINDIEDHLPEPKVYVFSLKKGTIQRIEDASMYPRSSFGHALAGGKGKLGIVRQTDSSCSRGELDILTKKGRPFRGLADAYSIADANGKFITGSPLHLDCPSTTETAYSYLVAGKKIRMLYPSPNGLVPDAFGYSVAGGKKFLGIGAALYDDTQGITDAGRAYLYRVKSPVPAATYLNPLPRAGDRFGHAIALLEKLQFPDRSKHGVLAVGAPYCDTKGTDAGAVYFYKVPLK